MNEPTRKNSSPHSAPATPEGERRRILGEVVHDDRGNASVRWQDAPSDYERPVLEVLGNPKLSVKADESYDPYARRASRGRGNGARTDLRKLSEWIKLMRELDERKRRPEGSGQD